MLVLSNQLPARVLRKPFTPCLPFTACCPAFLARRMVDACFDELKPARVSCVFINDGPLAFCCWSRSAAQLDIYLHNVLNHADTPQLVLEYLIKHELLHLRVAPVVMEEETLRHPPEFMELEKQICPERLVAWTWLYVVLGEHLRVRPQAQRVDVASSWKSNWHLPRPDVSTALKTRHRFTRPARRYV
jgi:hypothetical protein